jgi:hypothetical protein
MEIGVKAKRSNLHIQLGDAVLEAEVHRISVPSLGIDLRDDELRSHWRDGEVKPLFASALVGLLANLLKGNRDSAEAKVLAGLTKLEGRYAKHLLSTLATNPREAVLGLERLLQFENRGYWYFPKAQQLLIRPVERNDQGVLIEFLGPYQASCTELWESETAEALIQGIETGLIKPRPPNPPRMSPPQVKILERATSQEHLPQETVDIIRRIALYVDYHTLDCLFENLRCGGLRDEEERAALISRTNDILAEKARIEHYERAQNQEFVFLEDREELVVPELKLLVQLGTESPQALQVVFSKSDYEVGKYIVTGKWSKDTQLEVADQWHLNRLAERGAEALARLPEPYRSRLAAFLLHTT